ncbi:MAG: hypothetical protein ABL974_09285 [Prosthecobacter sp.]
MRVDGINGSKIEPQAITHIFEAKEARRRRLAGMSYPDKVKAVVRLQEMAAPVLRQSGRNVQVWRIGGLHESPRANQPNTQGLETKKETLAVARWPLPSRTSTKSR